MRLSGFIHTDDKLALREIWRQLGREMEVEDELVNKVLLFLRIERASLISTDKSRLAIMPIPWPPC